MYPADPSERILDAPSGDFATSLLSLYSEPHVRVRIGSAGTEYKLSKALLCKQSPYFAATFEGKFREGEEQSTTLTEIDGVVSTQSFEMLVQWLYLGRIILGSSTPEDAIAAIIEFVRFADMCGVTGMEYLMAKHIKTIIIANPPAGRVPARRDPDTNTRCLDSQHIKSAASLPEGHPVRGTLAMASVEGYLRHENFKFRREVQDVPGFCLDLLKSVRTTLSTIRMDYNSKAIACKDPLSGETIWLKDVRTV